MKTSLVIDLAGNLQARAREYTKALTGLSQRGGSALSHLKTSAAAVGRGLDAMGNRYTALVTGVGAAAMLKGVVATEERMTRLGIAADVSGAKVNALGQKVYDAAQAPDIRLDPTQILAAIESVMEKTGDLKFAEENIRNIGLAIQATGADGAAIGDIFAEFQKQGMSSKQALVAVDTLIAQGKAGAFTLKDLASLGPRVVTAYTALGRTGPQAMREMGAVLQLIRMGTGSSEQAATAWEAMLRTFSDKKKVKLLEKQGVVLFDKKGNLRAANEIMVEILRAAGNDAKNLSDVFDAEAIRAFNAILGEMKRTGGAATLSEIMQAGGSGETVLKDSARAASTASAALTNLSTAWTRFADAKLTEPIQHLADLLNDIGSDKAQRALDVTSKVAVALGGVLVTYKAIRGGVAAVGAVRGLFGKGKAGAAAASGGLGGRMPLPLPVYVVNSRMALTNDALSDMVHGRTPAATGSKDGPTKQAAGKGSKPAGRSGTVTKASTAAVMLDAVIDAGAVLLDDNATTDDKIRGVSAGVGSAAGGWAGASAGAALGAALGSVVPVIGTAIGGALGGLLGAFGGSWGGGKIGELAGDMLTGKDQAKAIGAEVAAQSKGMAKELASATTIKVAVSGPATASVAAHTGPAQVDLYAGLSPVA